jgi:hypothetical protein
MLHLISNKVSFTVLETSIFHSFLKNEFGDDISALCVYA